ncbi:unnamed protein product [Lactuca virosa]|uniref:Uncharacterized protein n=1 Tax=Lactuca virosa TaxID=75947 RepID=A0AAU9PW30_9ASTR|nr:unnamed protein product [Lactuca virosa]
MCLDFGLIFIEHATSSSTTMTRRGRRHDYGYPFSPKPTLGSPRFPLVQFPWGCGARSPCTMKWQAGLDETTKAWRRLFQIQEVVYKELVVELLASASFRRKIGTLEEANLTFGLGGERHELSLADFMIKTKIYLPSEPLQMAHTKREQPKKAISGPLYMAYCIGQS